LVNKIKDEIKVKIFSELYERSTRHMRGKRGGKCGECAKKDSKSEGLRKRNDARQFRIPLAIAARGLE
jgi:hypothetical protein